MVVEKVKKQLALIKKNNPEINAFLHVYGDQALEQAKEVSKKIKNKTAGKLAGVTFGIKSLINVKGMICNGGGKTLENYTSTYDADVITKLRQEDAIILGMLACDEFGCGGSGEYSAFGPTINPIAKDRIPGGSSSGSAAAIAAGFCDASLGTDTGGSVRNPASHCGVVGIKPSYGRVSRYGMFDLAMSLDQVGVLAKTVKDAALIMEVISGMSVNDPTTYDKDVLRYSALEMPPTLKIGIPLELMNMCKSTDIMKLTQDTIDQLSKENGITAQNISIKFVNLAVQTYYPIVYTELYSGSRKLDGRKYGFVVEQAAGEEVRRRIAGGKIISQAEHKGMYYRKALKAMQLVKRAFESAFEEVDVIMLPTTPDLPRKLGTMPNPKTEYAADAFTIPANLSGICAGVVPNGTIVGIPVGLQIMAPAFKEDLLFAVMKKVEELV